MAKEAAAFLVSARKYRPQTFDDVHGQEHVTRTLANAVRRGRIAHAYLLCGPRGVGKTTVARILSRAFNCERGVETAPCNECDSCRTILQGRCVDVLEIDAASNTGVDNIRDLRENAQLPPAQVKFKVYVIDEVHRLSGPAFDALLKILEEPPRHVKFIFATTEVHKVPSTILSRCQRFTFHRVPSHTIVQHLNNILKDQPDVRVPEELREEMLYAIARASGGAVRDSLSLFDQVLSFCGDTVNMDDVRTVLGLVSFETLSGLVESLMSGNVADVIRRVHAIVEEGRDPGQLAEDIVGYYRDLMVANVTGGKCQDIVELPPDDLKTVIAQSSRVTPEGALRAVEVLWEATRRMSFDPDPLLVLEVAAAKVALIGRGVSIDDLIDQINKLQGAPAPATLSVAQPVEKKTAAESLTRFAPPAGDAPRSLILPVETEQSPAPATVPAPAAPAVGKGAQADETVVLARKEAEPAIAPAPPPAEPAPVRPAIAEPAADLAVPEPAVLFEKIVAEWPGVVAKLKKDVPMLGFSLQDVTPLRVKGTTLVLGVPVGFDFYLENLSNTENRSILTTAFNERLGYRLAITAEISADVEPAASHPEAEAEAPESLPGRPLDQETVIRKEPVVARVLELFEGRIAAIRPAI